MTATLTLIRKELRQHRGPFFAVAFFFVLLAVIALVNAYLGAGVAGAFGAVGGFLRMFLFLAAMVICGRLVVTEYRGRTQLFLEALPLRRTHMILVKYCIGLALLFGLSCLVTGIAALMGWGHEVYTGRFVLILLASLFAACFFWHGFFFLTGFTGRYRYAIWLALLIVVPYLHQNTEWSAWESGPFRALDERFGYERETFPAQALRECLSFGGGFLLMSLLLGLFSEGSLAGLMGEKMSIREKVLFTAILIGLFMASQTLQVRKPPLPYEPPGSVAAVQGVVTVRASGDEARARALANRVAGELGPLAEALELAKAPPVFLNPRPDFAAWQFERGLLVNTDGVLAEGNYENDGFPEDRFVAWIIGEWLDALPGERARVEEKRWPRSGAGWYWVRRARMGEPLAADRDLALRALLATEGQPVTEAALRDWFTTNERLGTDVAEGLAWSGLRTLAREQGGEAVTKLLRQLYVVDLPNDVRALLRDKPNLPGRALPEVTGLAYSDLLESWNQTLEAERPGLAEALAALPRIGLELRFDAEGESTVAVHYRASLASVPPGPVNWRLRWAYLKPFDSTVDETELYDVWHTTDADEAAEWRPIFDRFTVDGRIYATLTFECPEIGGALISGWQRRFVRPVTP